MRDTKIDVYLVCNAKYHGTNFSGLDWLNRLVGYNDVSVTLSDNYTDIELLGNGALLITYGCDLSPSEQEQQNLQEFLASGGRWFSVQGISALLGFTGSSRTLDSAKLPCIAPALMPILGSRFKAMSEMQILEIKVSDLEPPMEEDTETVAEEGGPYHCDTLIDIIFC